MLPNKEQDQELLPSHQSSDLSFQNYNPISKAHYYHVFSALSRSKNQNYTIKVLDLKSEFYKQDPDIAATLFIQ